MNRSKNLVALALLLCLTTLVAAVSAGPTSILPTTTGPNSHVIATGGSAPSPSQLASISPLAAGLATGATVQLDATNGGSQIKTTVSATASPLKSFNLGVVLTSAAPTVGQALAVDTHIKFIGAGTSWAAGNVVVYDTNGNNVDRKSTR